MFLSPGARARPSRLLDSSQRADGKGLWWDQARGAYIHAYASPKNAVADLRDFMDARHGVGGWAYRTGVGVGTDCGPAMSDALQALRSRYGRGVLFVPPTGSFRLATAPAAADYSGNIVRGAGTFASQIVYDNTTGVAFNFSGASGFTGGGVESLNLQLEDGYAASTATAFNLSGDATNQPDNCNFEHLYVTAIGASFWQSLFLAIGTARTAPQGVRVLTMKDLQLFTSHTNGVQLYNVVQATVDNVGTYSGTGTGNDWYISGGGAANTNSISIWLTGVLCSGTMNVANCSDIMGDIKTVNWATGATWTTSRIKARISGTKTGAPGAGATLVAF